MGEWSSHHADTVGSQEQRGFESHRHNMEKEIKAIKILMEAGVPKETTIAIMSELVINSDNYANSPANIDRLLRLKLSTDAYISVKGHFEI